MYNSNPLKNSSNSLVRSDWLLLISNGLRSGDSKKLVDTPRATQALLTLIDDLWVRFKSNGPVFTSCPSHSAQTGLGQFWKVAVTDFTSRPSDRHMLTKLAWSGFFIIFAKFAKYSFRPYICNTLRSWPKKLLSFLFKQNVLPATLYVRIGRTAGSGAQAGFGCRRTKSLKQHSALWQWLRLPSSPWPC